MACALDSGGGIGFQQTAEKGEEKTGGLLLVDAGL